MAMLRGLYCMGLGRPTTISPSLFFRPSYLQARNVKLKVSAAQPVKVLPHDEKNEILGRPMSPHLTIYKPQLTAVLSLSHRTSGIILSFYAIVLATASLTTDVAQLAHTIQAWHLPVLLTIPLKFGIGLPAAFHLFNGIRHLIWDAGHALKMKEVYITGYSVVGLSLLLAFYMAI
ncbi:hypothetical protein O3M35_000250 [Rhynocoris fuscipes]|uniref:Succinate dehydrogenase cytochrome b560 subunit, mitochondrial n=1 Tax=Rhynocoris fuscipes TaxID=488301 RepID=A0AAW1DN25_9HEMI